MSSDANPFIDDSVEVDLSFSKDHSAQPIQAAAIEPAVEVINFWATPAISKGAKTAIISAANYQIPAEEICQSDLEEKSTVIGVGRDFVSNNALPLALSVLFAACSFSFIGQLNYLADSNVQKASLLVNSGKLQESLAAANFAIKCNPFSAASYYQKSRSLTHLMRYSEAKECLDSALNLSPDNDNALCARAALSLKMDLPAQTIVDTKRLIALSLTNHKQLNAMQYGNLAIAYYKIGMMDNALKAYEQALKYAPQDNTLSLGKAYCLVGKGQHQAALAICSSLLSQNSANARVLALRGYCYQRLNHSDLALRDFNLALSKDPKNAAFYSYRAALMQTQGHYYLAASDHVMAANIDRSSSQLQWSAAKILRDLGRDQDALTFYNRLSQFSVFNKSFDQLQERAALNFKLGNYRASLGDLDRAIALEPDCDLRLIKAFCQARLNQASQARETIAEAYRISPDQTAVTLADAQVESILGQSLSAIDKYSKVLSLANNDKQALSGRATLYFNRGQWASAAQDFRQAIALGDKDAQSRANLNRCQSILNSGAKIKLDIASQRLIEVAKLSDAALSDGGNKAYQNDDMQAASIYFSELTKRQPSNFDARRNLAMSLEASGQHTEAIAIFEPLSVDNHLDAVGQACYAHALAAGSLYERSIAIMQRLHDQEPKNVAYCLDLVKIYSAAGQIDRALGICRYSLALNGSADQHNKLNNVYESLLTEKLRNKNDVTGAGNATTAAKPETEG